MASNKLFFLVTLLLFAIVSADYDVWMCVHPEECHRKCGSSRVPMCTPSGSCVCVGEEVDASDADEIGKALPRKVKI
ncbi:hypothetical protein ABFS83_14G236300 [Erythranthe nasuta]